MRLQVDFLPGHPREGLRLGDERLAPLPAAPALPVAQPQLFLAQRFDAPRERGIYRAGLERDVDRAPSAA